MLGSVINPNNHQPTAGVLNTAQVSLCQKEAQKQSALPKEIIFSRHWMPALYEATATNAALCPEQIKTEGLCSYALHMFNRNGIADLREWKAKQLDF